MSIRLITETLLDSIKRRSLVPISQQTYQDADLIAFANEEMGINLVPEIQKVREDLFLRPKQSSIVSGKTKYLMPERAIGNALKSVVITSSDATEYELPRIDLTRSFGQSDLQGRADSFYLEDNYVVFTTIPDASGSVTMWYYQRPNALIETSSCAKVTGISTASGTTTLTVDTNLTGSLSIGDFVDVISGKSPFITLGDDVAITNITASTIEVLATGIDDENGSVQVVVGDYVCPAKYSNIPMIPQEFHPVLAQMVACRLLEGLGDLNKLKAANEKLNEMKSNAIALIANRVENAVEYFNNRNSILNSAGRINRRSVY
jgi:hypothetical protein